MHHLPYSFWGPWRPADPQPKFFSLASLAVLHLLFQNSLLLLKMLKALGLVRRLEFKPIYCKYKKKSISFSLCILCCCKSESVVCSDHLWLKIFLWTLDALLFYFIIFHFTLKKLNLQLVLTCVIKAEFYFFSLHYLASVVEKNYHWTNVNPSWPESSLEFLLSIIVSNDPANHSTWLLIL